MKLKSIFTNINPFTQEISNPYLIAEAGVNHEGRLDLASRLIDEAKEGGADAIKFQTYKAGTLASRNSPSYWDTTKEGTRSQFELFSKYDKFWKKEFEHLKRHCDNADIEFQSTPFDTESADFLNDLMDVFKISSSDITNKPFIEYICQFNKPIILSTGASFLYEIQEAVNWIEAFKIPIALLHCVLNYPTMDKNANLGMIRGLKRSFPDKIIGYSDHTVPADMNTLQVATLLGASILEKHFTFDKKLPGNDHYHAMDKNDIKVFRENIRRQLELVGTFSVIALEEEAPARKNARRSLVSKRKIPANKIIDLDDLTWKRPAHGISPKYINQLIGRKSIVSIEEDTILQWNLFT